MNETILSEYDFIIAIDASGSMGETDIAGGRSRWDHVQETAVQFARELNAIDSDGIDVVFFGGSRIDSFDGVGPDKVKELFASRRPAGSTPLAEALSAALRLAGKSDKKDFIVVFTDGVPDDKAAAAKVIVDQTQRQEKDEDLTILFVQVGYDKSATAYLQQLDDNLTGAKFDIVDAKTVEETEGFASLSELLIHAIND